MNEGEALTLRFCRLWNGFLPDSAEEYDYAYVEAFCPTWDYKYRCKHGGYENAEAIHVEPLRIEIEDCISKPGAPSHEEILRKWWKDGAGWYRIGGYAPGLGYLVGSDMHCRGWFATVESADTPPER